jgi:hypothetical protein
MMNREEFYLEVFRNELFINFYLIYKLIITLFIRKKKMHTHINILNYVTFLFGYIYVKIYINAK